MTLVEMDGESHDFGLGHKAEMTPRLEEKLGCRQASWVCTDKKRKA